MNVISKMCERVGGAVCEIVILINLPDVAFFWVIGGAVCEIVILINLPDVAFFWVNDNPELLFFASAKLLPLCFFLN